LSNLSGSLISIDSAAQKNADGLVAILTTWLTEYGGCSSARVDGSQDVKLSQVKCVGESWIGVLNGSAPRGHGPSTFSHEKALGESRGRVRLHCFHRNTFQAMVQSVDRFIQAHAEECMSKEMGGAGRFT
jgi:hypothetical protein